MFIFILLLFLQPFYSHAMDLIAEDSGAQIDDSIRFFVINFPESTAYPIGHQSLLVVGGENYGNALRLKRIKASKLAHTNLNDSLRLRSNEKIANVELALSVEKNGREGKAAWPADVIESLLVSGVRFLVADRFVTDKMQMPTAYDLYLSAFKFVIWDTEWIGERNGELVLSQERPASDSVVENYFKFVEKLGLTKSKNNHEAKYSQIKNIIDSLEEALNAYDNDDDMEIAVCRKALENAEIIPLEFDADIRYQIVPEINRLYKTFLMGQLVWFERADRANELDDEGIISRHNCASLILQALLIRNDEERVNKKSATIASLHKATHYSSCFIKEQNALSQFGRGLLLNILDVIPGTAGYKFPDTPFYAASVLRTFSPVDTTKN